MDREEALKIIKRIRDRKRDILYTKGPRIIDDLNDLQRYINLPTLDKDIEELFENVFNVLKQGKYEECEAEVSLRTIKQALIDSKKKINDYKQAWEHHYNLAQELQSKLDKIAEVVKDYDINDVYKAQDYMQLIIQILCDNND